MDGEEPRETAVPNRQQRPAEVSTVECDCAALLVTQIPGSRT
jgi:hypothetical protein